MTGPGAEHEEWQSGSGPLCLWYDRPAAAWDQALPIGNGRLGAMVHGGARVEHLQLNEDTLWSGYPSKGHPRPHASTLAEVRRLVMREARYADADKLATQFQGPFNESYLPLAHLLIECEGMEDARDYRRWLDLETAITGVRFRAGQDWFTREIFASAVHQVVIVRLTCTAHGRISFVARLDSPLPAVSRADGTRALALRGKAPRHVVSHHLESAQPLQYADGEGMGMRFEARVLALAEGGKTWTGPTSLRVEGASSVTLFVAAGTGYRGFGIVPDLSAEDIGRTIDRTLSGAAGHDYEALRSAHLAEYTALFRRVALTLGSRAAPDRPTDQRLRADHVVHDPALAALYSQYARYLLIASSRPGTQPANLQGIWNDQPRPVWGSDYTININIQMNYWIAEMANLAVCHEPFLDLIRDLSMDGRETARQTYGARGWACHNGTDIWRGTWTAGGGYSPADWSMWPMAGPWLCRHLWDRFAFGGDIAYLRRTAYPIMKGAAEFCLDWLVEDDDGCLLTCPSTSPENSFLAPDGRMAAVSAASTMDLWLIRDLFTNCIDASQLLDVDEPWRAMLNQALERLLPARIGRYGQLQEWSHDFDEADPGHRHLSHLYGLHPGNAITPHGSPDLADAAARSLERRLDHGGGQTGWSRAWIVNMWARLGQGDRAHESLMALLATSTLPNLFNQGPPFQIDGNFGGASGIFEMLLQSHAGVIEFLPALPSAWPDGTVRGLRARGGCTVEMSWSDGMLDHASIVADRDTEIAVRYGRGVLSIDQLDQPISIHLTAAAIGRVCMRAGVPLRLRMSSDSAREPTPTHPR